MIPELVKASCSMAGASNKATQDGRLAGGLVQLRALDWDTTGPFQQAPLLITWHPAAGNGHAFTSLGWAGLLGSMTGASSAGLGVSEKVRVSVFLCCWCWVLLLLLLLMGSLCQREGISQHE
jgi:hypothetical protein